MASSPSAGKTAVEAVFWDIDGTLIDSEGLHYEVIAEWCRRRGYLLSRKDNEVLLGKSMLEKWQYLAGVHSFHADLELFCRECAAMYCGALNEGMGRGEPLAVFRKIDQFGVPQACVSNGDMQVVEANLALLGLRRLVRLCISGEDVKNGKPSPEPYLLAAKRLGVNAEKCLVVEDSIVGVQAALAAGMTVVAWPEAAASRKEYPAVHYFVNSGEEFPWELFGVSERK